MSKLKYAYIGIGTNLGEKFENIQRSFSFIEEKVGVIVKRSKLYKTPPWGFNAKEDFFNCVVKIETKLDPVLLLQKLKHIESIMGRELLPKQGYQSRIIDLDIIDYNNQVYFSRDLDIPHLLLCERNFVLYPLRDLDSNWKHPIKKTEISRLIDNLSQSSIEIVKNDL